MAYAIVTGAAKGIGKAIAFELAKRNYNLILIDIDEKGLLDTANDFITHKNIDVQYLHIDLCSAGAAEHIFKLTRPYHEKINVVVNNAGFGLNGAFEQLPLDEQLDIIDLNIKAQVKLSHLFIPVLKQKEKSYLLNVGSTTAYQSVPYLNIYAASKAFVLSFTRSLRYELRNTNVSVSCLSPGSTDTNFVYRASMSEKTIRIAQKFYMTPEKVADIAVKQLFKGKAEIIPGFSNKINAYLPKFFPKRFVEKIAASIYEKKAPLAEADSTKAITQSELSTIN
ncbi:MAG TPA: SDR family oxidoreductase [Ferruginibacter sp.]|nr:SDR family oxidoreductase [Ferruginibacter sp.]HMP22098.1 SDR family oxidoreductase [Ferruginibacter sp.]